MKRVWHALAVGLVFGNIVWAQQGEKAEKSEEPDKEPAPAGKMVKVKIETSLGDIVLELDGTKAPITVDNFLQYVDAGFYDGTIFHRVMPEFMIQGGGYTADLTEKQEGLRPPIKNEWQNGLKNDRGTIAMARKPTPDSATAQFFINVVNNDRLSQPTSGGAGYAVFGKVVEGMEVVDKIKDTSTKEDPKLPMGKVVPVEPVVITSVKRAEGAESESPEKKP